MNRRQRTTGPSYRCLLLAAILSACSIQVVAPVQVTAQERDMPRAGSILSSRTSEADSRLPGPERRGPDAGNLSPGTPVPQQESGAKAFSGPLESISRPENAVVFAETLEAAWARALTLSRDLEARGYQTEAAQWNTRAARGLGLPKVANTTAAVSMQDQVMFTADVPLLQALGSNVMPISNEDFVASVTSITVPLYQGGRVRALIQSAMAAANASASGQKIGEQDLKYQVAESYFLVLRMRKLLDVAQDAAQSLTAHEKDATRMLETGLVTRNVLLAAQVARAEADQNVLRARNAVQLAEAAYNRLLWRPLTSPVAVEDSDIPLASGDYETLAEDAIQRRPELAALTSQSQALSAQGKVHRANVRPQIALVGAHSYIENDYVHPNSNFTGAVGMTWVPFDGGTSRSRMEAANLEAMAVTKQQEDARTAIELQVYQGWLAENESRERLHVAELATKQADENLRVVNHSFQEGLVNHTEVLDAQTLRTQAWTNFEHARYDAILATWKLRRAVGNL